MKELPNTVPLFVWVFQQVQWNVNNTVIFCVFFLRKSESSSYRAGKAFLIYLFYFFYFCLLLFTLFCSFLKLPEPAPASCLPAGLSLKLVEVLLGRGFVRGAELSAARGSQKSLLAGGCWMGRKKGLLVLAPRSPYAS